jgi:hypothetical protein
MEAPMTDHLPIRPDSENERLCTHSDGPTPENNEISQNNEINDFNEVNIRRYLIYVEHSLGEGTQWTVFEPNGEALWARVRTTVTDFLASEWHSGKLQGAAAEQAFFVRCDQTTMTQNDIDNGRLNIVIGIAPVRPAEFVIIEIRQWTAGHKP